MKRQYINNHEETIIVADPNYPFMTWVYFLDPDRHKFIGGWTNNY